MPKAGAAGVLGVLALLLLLAAPDVFLFPRELRLLPGQEYILHTSPLFTVSEVTTDSGSILSYADGASVLCGTTVGEHSLQLRAFGFLPVRAARIHVVPEMHVVPGGQAVGILLSASGLLVVRTIPVTTVDGKSCYPAREAGLKAGDVLLKVGGTELAHPSQIEEEATSYGRRGLAMPVVVQRDGRLHHLQVRPVLGRDSKEGANRFLLGILVKDPVAGVGTLTFWDAESRRFGALGHVITNEERRPVRVDDGRIVPAHIHSIQPGMKGRPGEKMGLFDEGAAALGKIDRNTHFGIYGTLFRFPEQALDPVPVAMVHEVKPGPAEILTVLDGESVERFQIQILEVHRQSRSNGKGLVIKVTDPRLLRRTNGIVQGMSGSPILQNNRLVGAVTHVYINDPTRGFGILAEWMIYEAGIDLEPYESHVLLPQAS
ncbi:MAG: SpoIVB peptidase [Limnochordia bacterium]